MNLLVIGGGGREHAIAKALKKDKCRPTVYCCPGNVGMKSDGIEIVAIESSSFDQLIQFAKEKRIDWTFVGPEQPLLEGIVDAFQEAGLRIFGPGKNAAMLEGSKSFAKKVMDEAKVATADYEVFTEMTAALNYLETVTYPIVLKADGLAAGKGVVIPETKEEAIQTIHDMMDSKIFGDSGSTVVIEEFLEGEEFTLLAFVDEQKVYPMIPAQDHKRVFEGDLGPNTGGMGAYAPVPQISEAVIEESVTSVLQPVANYMSQQGTPYVGILYAGLILTKNGPKVIEFNARFGDPEAQVILPLLETSLLEIISDLLEHKTPTISWSNQVSLGVVVARDGYPSSNKRQAKLPNLTDLKEAEILYSGVKEESQQLYSDGGRVFLVQVMADDFTKAKEKIYSELTSVNTNNFFYRRDIGHKIK